jgi:Flp pilus assembly protein TadG
VVVPFVFVLYALVALGMALAVKQSVTSAAAEGARSAVGVPDPVTTATSTVANRLAWLNGKYVPSTDLTIVYFNPGTNVCDSAYAPAANATGVSLCVTVNVPYKARQIVPPAPIVNGIMPAELKSTAIVQIS